MNGTCETCGLPKALCVCSQIEKEQQKIRIRRINRKFGKVITLIAGLDTPEHAKELGKTLKRKLACGGTHKGTEIELQGDHMRKVKEILLAEGYNENLIEM